MDSSKLLDRTKSAEIIIKPITPDVIRNSTKIFVVGPPRSGTTLLHNIIAKDLFIPECTFVSTLMKVFDEMYKYSDDARFAYYGDNLTNLVEIFKKPVYDLLFTAALKSGMESESRYVFKDPILTLYLDYFPLFFGTSYKVVFCVRDPRDAVASMIRVHKQQNDSREEQALFHDVSNFLFPFYMKINDIDRTDPTRSLLVKYEDIVAQEPETIARLEDFLGFGVDLQGSEIAQGKVDETSPFYSPNYGKPVTTSPVGGYKRSLSREQVLEVQRIFGYYFELLKYELEPA